MANYTLYSDEWKKEIKKLPKDNIIEIASQIGTEKQKEIDLLKENNNEMLEMLQKVVYKLKGNGFPMLQTEIEKIIKNSK